MRIVSVLMICLGLAACFGPDAPPEPDPIIIPPME
ncbi:hypothetical protein jaqu_01700 [Jannaschia aquimarina]|uniref:Lipoprotein n=1 Tax=Jannaschia aquimarina TaxID=935700 RepID=A0A0D1EQX5_9RHOB|nr:hypothetical protein jaqu_01700 [Jannaschia aquimarina]SNS89185.1 hypothetical protein SAMN05421775_103195 [Jannaschia aquimarina]